MRSFLCRETRAVDIIQIVVILGLGPSTETGQSRMNRDRMFREVLSQDLSRHHFGHVHLADRDHSNNLLREFFGELMVVDDVPCDPKRRLSSRSFRQCPQRGSLRFRLHRRRDRCSETGLQIVDIPGEAVGVVAAALRTADGVGASVRFRLEAEQDVLEGAVVDLLGR